MLKIQSTAGNCVFKVNNRNTRTRGEICSKLTIKIPERGQWRRSGIFTVNFEHISHLVLVFLRNKPLHVVTAKSGHNDPLVYPVWSDSFLVKILMKIFFTNST